MKEEFFFNQVLPYLVRLKRGSTSTCVNIFCTLRITQTQMLQDL